MVTIRQALLSVRGEDAMSIAPITVALSELGFQVDAEVGDAFCLLNAEQAAGLTVRQQLALKAAIQAAAAAIPPPGASSALSMTQVTHRSSKLGVQQSVDKFSPIVLPDAAMDVHVTGSHEPAT
ncbi:hypothetical protein VOLCADRAFT_87252 [Volvox carteri f. nagariensis]|uniref:Uncharacterized protein n=1 Tax=Volvox carteri f. nagariensis TaxID=3068 RepID=D8TKJ6_VOLCA|nr:uncharacterized protein VOLCADRAFT_87252 [Volvox carteri f. nagariensis]EFJ52260.1 hypothetical protein VOLCADRAFT_87252 [Volvox carteri f. nagariensis]|eukprot:XP_002947034.1 hypothetical protein VOLCADRAFT_87252 [Volvox carteri f. nagariensis]